jgi:hypothetical protein
VAAELLTDRLACDILCPSWHTTWHIIITTHTPNPTGEWVSFA